MYYHVLIESKIKKLPFLRLDLTQKEDIIKEIAQPYLKNEEILIEGYTLRKDNITRIKIVVTKEKMDVLIDKENNNIPDGIFMLITSEYIIESASDITKEILDEAKNIDTISVINTNWKQKFDISKIFIVHGRDNGTKQEVARFIEKLDYEPVILNEQPDSGLTIIEKLEKNSEVGFAIVLYTPCDLGSLNNNKKTWKPRARQNVVFEHGYLMAKLGRDRVIALIKGDVEKPSDIDGIVYVPFGEDDGWKLLLARNLRNAGYTVDLNKCYN